MITIPAAVQNKVQELGQAILDGNKATASASAELAKYIQDGWADFAKEIVGDWSRRRLQSWKAAVTDSGQIQIPFPDLPARLEIAPGKLAPQGGMTGPDWDNAKAIWRNRRDQAEIGWQTFERRYNQVRPLLTDPALTTTDVLDGLGALAVNE